MTHFEESIKRYLDQRATTDTLFAEKYKNPNKSIEDCCKFILGEVSAKADKNGYVALSDEETYGLAVHYYDEEKIDYKPIKGGGNIGANVTYTPTPADMEIAKKNAMKRLEDEEIAKMRAKASRPKPKEPETSQQMSLF